MIVAAALLAALAFGGADQYLGSFSSHPWAADASLLSAPWLVLPFLVGWTQRDPRRGALLGLGCTAAALLGYGLMTLSPLENAHLDAESAVGFVRSQRLVAGAIVTGPLFGWWGSRWRTDRAWAGALVTAVALCLEPLAHRAAPQRVAGVFLGRTIEPRAVWIAEVAVGAALAIYVLVEVRRERGRRRGIPARA